MMSHCDFSLPYNLLDQTKKVLDELNFEVFKEDYAENIIFSGRLPEAGRETLETFLRDSSKGAVILNTSKTVLE